MNVNALLARRQERRAEIRNYVSVPLLGIGDIFGLNMSDGDLVVVFGEPKHGKTTLSLNWCRQLAHAGFPVTVASTESVMTAERYALCLLTLEVAEILHREERYDLALSPDMVDNLVLSDDLHGFDGYLVDAYEEALDRFEQFNIDIYGAALADGGMTTPDNLFKLIRECPYPSCFILDQINQVTVPGQGYVDSAITLMRDLAKIIKECRLATIVVSQVSTSSKDRGQIAPLGGNLIIAEANLAINPQRDGNKMIAYSPRGFSRGTPPFTAEYQLEPCSGLLSNGRIIV